MFALRIARAVLLLSAVSYLTSMALIAVGIDNLGVLFWMTIGSIVGLAISATICIALQFVVLPWRQRNPKRLSRVPRDTQEE